MERYEAYKDSGIEWINQVPSKWEEGALAHYAEILGSGATPSSDNELYYDGDIPWLQVRDLGKCRFATASRTITNKALDDCSAIRMYRAPFLAIAMYASIGSISFIEQDAAVNQAICAISNGTMDLRYLYYHLLAWGPYLLADGQGGTQKNISQQYIRKLRILAPSLKEQQAIADYLDAKTTEIDTLVADCEREVELLQEYRKAVISEAVTRGLGPDAPMKDSGVDWIGEIPAHWNTNRIKNGFAVVAGATPKSGVAKYWDGDIPWITPADYSETQHYVEGGCRSITKEGLDSCGTTLVPEGSVIVSNRAPIGLISVTSRALCTNQGCKALVPLSRAVSSEFLYWYLLTQTESLNSLGRGTTFLELSTQALSSFVFPCPPFEEQQAITGYLEARTEEIDSLVETKQSMADKLREYRKSLISEAVTGKFKVPGV